MSEGANGRGDDVRLLARRSEFGYTDRPDLALIEEPEAVTVDEQRELTARARRRDGQRRRAAYVAMASAVNAACDSFVAVVGADPRLAHGVRAVRRTTAALGREIAQ